MVIRTLFQITESSGGVLSRAKYTIGDFLDLGEVFVRCRSEIGSCDPRRPSCHAANGGLFDSLEAFEAVVRSVPGRVGLVEVRFDAAPVAHCRLRLGDGVVHPDPPGGRARRGLVVGDLVVVLWGRVLAAARFGWLGDALVLEGLPQVGEEKRCRPFLELVLPLADGDDEV